MKGIVACVRADKRDDDVEVSILVPRGIFEYIPVGKMVTIKSD